jgi:hypothetical protein
LARSVPIAWGTDARAGVPLVGLFSLGVSVIAAVVIKLKVWDSAAFLRRWLVRGQLPLNTLLERADVCAEPAPNLGPRLSRDTLPLRAVFCDFFRLWVLALSADGLVL